MSCLFAASSHIGLKRRRNEDAFHARSGSNLYVVCDGMGGHQEGQRASRMTVATVVDTMAEGGWLGRADVDPDRAGQALRQAIQAADLRLQAESRRLGLRKAMGTTIAAVLILAEEAVLASSGDSRVYLVQRRRHRRLTRDHTVAERFAELGLISRQAVNKHPYRGVLVHCVGLPGRCEVDLTRLRLTPGDRILLCTDGLTDLVDETVFIRRVQEEHRLDKVVSQLIDLTLDSGARDNVTVVLLECGPVPAHRVDAAA